MTQHRDTYKSPPTRQEDSELAAERQTASLAALALTLAVVVAGLFLINALRAPPQPDGYLIARDTPVAW